VARNGAAGYPELTVSLEYGGDAVHGQDYNARTSVVIPEDIVSTFVAWQPVDDTDLEWTERIDASVGESSEYTIAEWGGELTGWISDNEPNRVEMPSQVFANFNDNNGVPGNDWEDDELPTPTADPDLVPVDFYFPPGTPNYEAALDFSGGYGPPFKLWTDASKSQLVYGGNWTSFPWDQVPGLVGPGHAKLYLEAGGISGSPNDLVINFERREWSDTDPFPGGYGPGEGRATAVDPRPIVWVEATDATASEDGRDPAVFTVRREGGDGDTSSGLDVYFTMGGEAAASQLQASAYTNGITSDGTDYTVEGAAPDSANPGYWKVSIPSGQTSVQVTTKPLNDADYEATETVDFLLSDSRAPAGSPTYAAPAGNPATKPATAQARQRGTNLTGFAPRPTPNPPAPADLNQDFVDLGHEDEATRNAAQGRLTTHLQNHPSLEGHYIAKRDESELPEVKTRIDAILRDALPITVAQDPNTNKLKVTIRRPAPGAGKRYQIRLAYDGEKARIEFPGNQLDPRRITLPEGSTAVPDATVFPRNSGTMVTTVTLVIISIGGPDETVAERNYDMTFANTN
jgi:hypothetical protein